MKTDAPISRRPRARQKVFWGWVDQAAASFTRQVLEHVLSGERQGQIGAEWNERLLRALVGRLSFPAGRLACGRKES